MNNNVLEYGYGKVSCLGFFGEIFFFGEKWQLHRQS